MGNSPNIPDPNKGIQLGTQLASGQQDINTKAGVTSQQGSMVNQFNPYGSLIWGTDPAGRSSANVNLSQQQQQLFDLLMGSKKTAGQGASDLLTKANYGASPASDVIGGMTSGTTKDLLDKEVSFLQPFQQTERDQLDTRLRNQGFFPKPQDEQSPYNNAMRALDTSHSLAVQDFLAKAEPQAFSQAVTSYGLPASLAAQLAQFGAPGDPTQNLVSAPRLNIQPANLIGATGTEQSALNDQYKNQLAKYTSNMQGMFGIPTAILGGWAKSGGVQGLGNSLGSMFG